MLLRLSGIACGALVALAASVSLPAQCGEPQFGPVLGTGDDVLFPIQSLGFAFPFAGQTYTDVHISTNGLLYLSNGGTPAPGGNGCCGGNSTTLVAGSPIIAPYWTDNNAVLGVGRVRYNNSIAGKAVITWENVYEYAGTVPRTFQCQLSVNGEIYFSYDQRCVLATHTLLIGCSEGGGAALPAASDLSASMMTGTNTLFETFTTAANPYDLASQTLLLLPTGPGWVWVNNTCPAGSTSLYGSGCYEVLDNSAYSLLTGGAAVWSPALQGTAVTFVPNGSTYLLINGGNAYVAPTAAATTLTLTDDSSTASPTLTAPFPYAGGLATVFQVCSNGHVAIGTGNSTGFVPSAATMLNNPSTAWYSWTDYNPAIAAGGRVKFEEAGGMVYITWDGVIHFGNTTTAAADTFQFQFDTGTGAVTLVWQTMSTTSPTTTTLLLVGYSPGGPSNDPGSINLATQLPLPIPAGLRPLAIDVNQTLVSSATGGSMPVFTIANIPEFAPGAGVYLGVHILSLTQIPPPGLDLTFLGMPGCSLLANLDLTRAAIGLTATQALPLSIPPGLPLGVTMYSQGAALFTPGSLSNGQNAFGGITSNGIASTIGAW